MIVQPLFTSIYAQTVLFAARVDVQVAVNRVQLVDLHVVGKPNHPHTVLRAALLEVLVQHCQLSVWDVRTKVWRGRRLVKVKPILNINNDSGKRSENIVLVHRAVCIAGTHCANPQRDGQSELNWLADHIPRWFTRLPTVTYPSTNRARRRLTSLIRQNV